VRIVGAGYCEEERKINKAVGGGGAQVEHFPISATHVSGGGAAAAALAAAAAAGSISKSNFLFPLNSIVVD
jgi:hypothetical protein